ncbi:type II toxin-antitoxin system VapC family toxin [Enterorhabdus sp. P55]|uniref:type II toxin-antitoxin system VapC family toxin n=1 Tax=Enterorhabdus sp. P55 TaxID=2304571 RepID=UPI00136BE3C2|nr:type II toxin-antitoxin system VapC family toxin [Enterorhabdus sp. P55]
MNYVVDTNVVSELMRPQPSENVIDWFYDHEGQVWLTSITVKELYFGMLRLPEGKRKERLRQAITSIVMDCSSKTYSFDAFSAFLCAELHEQALSQGKAPAIEDLMIAAICKRNDCALATRNVKDFDCLAIDVINPFER